MYYFVSDIHLVALSSGDSSRREKLFVSWLERIGSDADAIFIVGDMFDFWYEYKRVIPKGFTRVLGKLSALTDAGIPIHFFVGNHDMWAYDYLEQECGLIVHHTPFETELFGKRCFISHGDDITARQSGLPTRFMNACFRSDSVRWLFSHLLHPDLAMRFGQAWSAHSRNSKSVKHHFLAENEPMVRFARNRLAQQHFDYFIFGHNHCAEFYPLSESSRAVFLGEWFESPVYAAMTPDGNISLHEVRI